MARKFPLAVIISENTDAHCLISENFLMFKDLKRGCFGLFDIAETSIAAIDILKTLI
jgi:hypothetical protein